jgi:hypothetical protein
MMAMWLLQLLIMILLLACVHVGYGVDTFVVDVCVFMPQLLLLKRERM